MVQLAPCFRADITMSHRQVTPCMGTMHMHHALSGLLHWAVVTFLVVKYGKTAYYNLHANIAINAIRA